MTNKKIYTEEDLRDAFIAGQEEVNYSWHVNEFCHTGCKCKPVGYNNFDEYLALKKEIPTIQSFTKALKT